MIVVCCFFGCFLFGKFPIKCILVSIEVLLPAAEAKMFHLSSLRSLVPRMWNDDLDLDKWVLRSRPSSLHQMMEQLKFIHSGGLVALSCSHLEIFA